MLKDSNANIYEKCVTFEGPPHLSESCIREYFSLLLIKLASLKGTALAVKVKEALDFIVNARFFVTMSVNMNSIYQMQHLRSFKFPNLFVI